MLVVALLQVGLSLLTATESMLALGAAAAGCAVAAIGATVSASREGN
jgi:hypothetical protein